MTIRDFARQINDLVTENDALKHENARLKRKPVGDKRPNRPKLTRREIQDIKLLFRDGVSITQLALDYGVHHSTISRTVSGIYNR